MKLDDPDAAHVTVETVKALPVGGIAAAHFLGIALSDWVFMIGALYTVAQTFLFFKFHAPRVISKYKLRKRKNADAPDQ